MAIQSIGDVNTSTVRASNTSTAASQTQSAAPETKPQEESAPADSVSVTNGAPKREIPEQAPAGFDQTKWNNPQHNTPKYVVGRALSTVIDDLRAIPDEAGRKKFAEDFLKTQIPAIEKAGGSVLQVKNEKILLDMNDGHGPHWVDAVFDIDGAANVQWCVIDDKPGQQQQAQASDAMGGFNPFGMFGTNDTFGMGQQLMNDPAIAQTVKEIQQAGGQVLHVSFNLILAEMGDGQGPMWVPVNREQSQYNRLGQQFGMGMFGQSFFSMVA
ncbi:MAG: hypothetical protein FJX76_17365 [Armatimonadetes bacterium]|nr:hypothetical protein [Armatimonadota bacterium]